MHHFDTNYWGLMAMPVGLMLCFAPALAFWLKAELAAKSSDKKRDRK